MAYRFNPHPKDMVVIRGFGQGANYTVPPGRIFVLTALGTVGFALAQLQPTILYVDGVPELTAGLLGGIQTVQSGTEPYGPWCTVVQVPECISFPAGSFLHVAGQPPAPNAAGFRGRAWGYLAAA